MRDKLRNVLVNMIDPYEGGNTKKRGNNNQQLFSSYQYPTVRLVEHGHRYYPQYGYLKAYRCLDLLPLLQLVGLIDIVVD